MDDELRELLKRVHSEISSFDYNGKSIPCLILNEQRFDQIMGKVAGKPLSVDTNLNILQNGLGDVFVEIVLTFSEGGIEEKILLNGNKSLDFFESMGQTSILALSSPRSHFGKDNVFMIQLPKPEKIEYALDIIKKGLGKKTNSF